MNIFCLLLMLSTPVMAFAKPTIVLKQNIRLTQFDSRSNLYWETYSFTEDQPGIISDNMLANGCGLDLYSKSKVVRAGSYKTDLDHSTSPSVWDSRKSRTIIANLSDGGEIIVSCKTSGGFFNSINARYMSKLGGNYFSVK